MDLEPRDHFSFLLWGKFKFLVTDEFQAGLVRVILSVFSQPNLGGAVLDLTCLAWA